MTDDGAVQRTLLANERTYLAWWRTGLTALTVALASARVVPELSDARHTWPYTIVGAAFAVLGVACITFAERRRRAVDRAYGADAGSNGLLALTASGVVLGVALFALIVFEE